MKNKFFERILFSIVAIGISITDILLGGTSNIYVDNFYILVGLIAFVYTIFDYYKYNKNRKEIDDQLSKEYDERDELVDGKVSKITLKVILATIFIVMFASKFAIINGDISLFIILVTFIITEFLARKYYNYII
ncbi:hypothetical protein [Terrisporobacter mayombei]|uniref:DUF2178 domain-containing protein n=1 Tax=Terrisporobacter mayombei TaxID=1541 RepID=A0ABY9Q3U5_9FIRM|nr:hypothetical protein [Terrisporobacter mayombei]MCC3869205.1 hypothetical protein [Terrisporobacter mayombei]WMT82658.1 hypothetical protein TEMA_31460 [Terrisporobacter mayombei]